MRTSQTVASKLAIAFVVFLSALNFVAAQTPSPDLTIRGAIPKELQLTLRI